MAESYDSICCFRSNALSSTKRVCWELTTDCNLNCLFCHRYGKIAQYYDVSYLSQTIALLKSAGINDVILSGGEPLLHPHIFNILSSLQKEGISVDICSNGTLINQHMAFRLKPYLSEISISIDGYNADRHEIMRNTKGCFDNTINAIQLLINNGFEVHTTTVVDESFCEQILTMVNYLVDLGVKSIAFLGLIPLNAGENALLNKNVQKMLVKQLEAARIKYPNISINTKQLVKTKSMSTCSAGRTVFGLDRDGLKLHSCLLTRSNTTNEKIDISFGFCPGSSFLTKQRGK